MDKDFTALRDAGLKLNAFKYFFGFNRVTYLGHIISKHGIEVDPDKFQAVRDFSVFRNTTEVRAFHGLCNYFRRFIPNFGETAKAPTDLCNKVAKLRWTGIQQLAFDHLKSLLTLLQLKPIRTLTLAFISRRTLLLLALAPSFTNYQMATLVLLCIRHMHLVTLNLTGEFPKKNFMH
jgi:hypothetical protein